MISDANWVFELYGDINSPRRHWPRKTVTVHAMKIELIEFQDGLACKRSRVRSLTFFWTYCSGVLLSQSKLCAM